MEKQYIVLYINGAFDKTHPSVLNKSIEQGKIIAKSRLRAYSSGIEEQAIDLLEYIKEVVRKTGKKVKIIAHSLGALVAYRAFQLDIDRHIEQLVLVNCGSIGRQMPMYFLNPMEIFTGLIEMVINPESQKAVYEALYGDVKLGQRSEGIVMVSGTNDTMIPPELSKQTAELINAKIIFVEGGHHLFRERTGSKMLRIIMEWFKTRKGLNKLSKLTPSTQ